MGGPRRLENGILIICTNEHTEESFTCETVAEASLRTGVSRSYISYLIQSGNQTKDGWTFDEWERFE